MTYWWWILNFFIGLSMVAVWKCKNANYQTKKKYGFEQAKDKVDDQREKEGITVKRKKSTCGNILAFIETKIPGGSYLASWVEQLFTYVFFKPNPII